MAKEIKLPKLSEDADEGTVAEVMIQKGDTIDKDDPVIAVENDKATVEVPSEVAGTVKEVKVSEGDTIKTGDLIAILEDDEESGNGEDKEEKKDESGQEEQATEEQDEDKEKESPEDKETEKEDKNKEQQKSDKKKDDEDEKQAEDDEPKDNEAEEDEKEKDKDSEEDQKKEPVEDEDDQSAGKEEQDQEKEEEEKSSSESGTIYAAPGAKRLAREHEVKLEDIKGSGPDGLIIEDDVKKAVGASTDTESVSGGALPDFTQWGTIERKPLSEIRKATAKQTQSSWKTVPHVTQFDEADVSGIEEYIEQHQDDVKEQGGKLTITAVLTKVIANALHQFPKFNASIDMEAGEVILKKYIHIGIAVDTEEGLLVPIVRDVDQKSIIELATEITGLAEEARNKELSTKDMKGGNFIISNLGGIGGTQFTPVIFNPQVAILGVSEMTTKPVYNKETESFQPVLTLPLSLSYDHRLIDGAEGARFLRYVCNALEDPYKAIFGE